MNTFLVIRKLFPFPVVSLNSVVIGVPRRLFSISKPTEVRKTDDTRWQHCSSYYTFTFLRFQHLWAFYPRSNLTRISLNSEATNFIRAIRDLEFHTET